MRRCCASFALAVSLMLFSLSSQGQDSVHRVGVLTPSESADATQALLEGFRARGYIVDQNLRLELRSAKGQAERIPALVSELVAFNPEVIIAVSPQYALAVHAAAPSIPLVFISVADPVALRLVDSLAHPGGNATGFTTTVPEGFIGKQLQLLTTLLPKASRIAVLINPGNPMHPPARLQLPNIGRDLGVELIVVEASSPDQYETAFETAQAQGAQAIEVMGDPINFLHSAKVAALAARYHLPAMYFAKRNVQDGGLISYGPNTADLWGRAPTYVDKILKGERPADLPVQQPTRFYLTVNIKTARSLGIAVPISILEQADDLVE